MEKKEKMRKLCCWLFGHKYEALNSKLVLCLVCRLMIKVNQLSDVSLPNPIKKKGCKICSGEVPFIGSRLFFWSGWGGFEWTNYYVNHHDIECGGKINVKTKRKNTKK